MLHKRQNKNLLALIEKGHTDMNEPYTLDGYYSMNNLHNNPELIGNDLEIYNYNSISNVYYNITTPLHLILMYNTCGTANVTDTFLSVSPAGSHYIRNDTQLTGISRPHRHNYFEFLIVLKGKVMQEIEGKEYLYPAGSCCLINHNITHTERFLEEGMILFLGLKTDFIRELAEGCRSSFFPDSAAISDNSIFTFMKENMDGSSQKYYLDFFPVYQNTKSTENLHRISDALVRTLFAPKLGADFVIKGLLYELFDYLDTKEAFHIIPVKLNSKNDALLFSRIRHLMEDTNGRMSRSELEKSLNYSGNYLNTIVKTYTGMNLFEYGMTFCMKEAARLLEETDLSVTAIAEALKFSNQGHFYKLFKQTYGMLPKEYRRVHKPQL